MRGYTIVGPNATGTATKTLITVVGGTTVRPCVHGFAVGSSTGTPLDVGANLAIRRFTAAGTAGSSPTPAPVDSADVASVATAGITHSAEPTYSGTLYSLSMNSRATFRFVANPGYEFKAPATAANGIGLQLVSAGASAVFDGTLEFFE